MQPKKKFLDLFTGSGGIAKLAQKHGYDVKTLDDCSEGIVSNVGITFNVGSMGEYWAEVVNELGEYWADVYIQAAAGLDRSWELV